MLRRFSFKPTQPLAFVSGKCRLLDNPTVGKASTRMNIVLMCGSTYIGSRLVRFYAEMGWLSFSFHSLAFFVAATFTRQAHNTLKEMVIAVDLLDSGKAIEVTSAGFLGTKQKTVLQIKDMQDPQDNPKARLYMAALSCWPILTKKQTFWISNHAVLHRGDVMDGILKGEEVDVSDTIQAEDIIDV